MTTEKTMETIRDNMAFLADSILKDPDYDFIPYLPVFSDEYLDRLGDFYREYRRVLLTPFCYFLLDPEIHCKAVGLKSPLIEYKN